MTKKRIGLIFSARSNLWSLSHDYYVMFRDWEKISNSTNIEYKPSLRIDMADGPVYRTERNNISPIRDHIRVYLFD